MAATSKRIGKRHWFGLLGLAVLATPIVLVALWLVFPLSAGIAVLLAVRRYKWPTVQRFARLIAYTYLLVFVIWLVFEPWRLGAAEPTSVTSGRITQAVNRQWGAPASPDKEDQVVVDRRVLASYIADARFNIDKIKGALETLGTAQTVFRTQTTKEEPDTAGLGPALEDLRAAMGSVKAPDAPGPVSLLEVEPLQKVVDDLSNELNEIDAKRRDEALTHDDLVKLQDRMPGFLTRRGVDALPTRVVKLENAVRQSLQMKLDSNTSCLVQYDRRADTISYVQTTTLQFHGSQPKAVDLTQLFPPRADTPRMGPPGLRGAYGTITVDVKGNGVQLGIVRPETPVVEPGLNATDLIVTRTITYTAAAQHVVNGPYLVSIKRIDLRWPETSSPAIVSKIRLPENPDRTFSWTVDTGDRATFSGVEIPSDSFIYSTPPSTPAPQSSSWLLGFGDKLTVKTLATSSPVSIEILPWWLSWPMIQEHKQYLTAENAFVGLLVALATWGFGLLVAGRGEPAQGSGHAAH